MRAGKPPAQIFREWDANGDGYLDYEEFVEAYARLQASAVCGRP